MLTVSSGENHREGASRRAPLPAGSIGNGGGPAAAAPEAAAWPLVLSRSESNKPLLSCGLTEEELAAITSSVESRVHSDEEPELAAGPPSATWQSGNAGAAPIQPAGTSPVTPPSDSTAARRDERRSFERVNRVATAVAIEKERRRSLQRRERMGRHNSHEGLSHHLRRQPLHVSGEELLPEHHLAASAGQLDSLQGPPTPSSALVETAAQRLAASSLDHIGLHPVAPTASRRAAADPSLLRSRLAAVANSRADPLTVRSSAPPHDAFWRQHQLLTGTGSQSNAGPHRALPPHAQQHPPEPLLLPVESDLEEALSATELPVLSSSSLGLAPAVPAAAEGHQAMPQPSSQSANVQAAAALGFSGLPPIQSHGNYTVTAGPAAAGTAGDSECTGCLPLTFGKGKSKPTAPHAVILRLTSESGEQPGQPPQSPSTPHQQSPQPQRPHQHHEASQDTPRRKKGLFSAFSRRMHI